MFQVFLGIFGVFTLIYALFVSAVIYHLKQYSLPGRRAPELVMSAFVFLSGLSWLFAIYFLFRIPQ